MLGKNILGVKETPEEEESNLAKQLVFVNRVAMTHSRLASTPGQEVRLLRFLLI